MISVSSEIKAHNFLMHILTFYKWIHASSVFFLHTWLILRLLHTQPLKLIFKIKVFYFPFQVTIKQFSTEPITFLWCALSIKFFSHFLDCKCFGVGGRGKVKLEGKIPWISLRWCNFRSRWISNVFLVLRGSSQVLIISLITTHSEVKCSYQMVH